MNSKLKWAIALASLLAVGLILFDTYWQITAPSRESERQLRELREKWGTNN